MSWVNVKIEQPQVNVNIETPVVEVKFPWGQWPAWPQWEPWAPWPEKPRYIYLDYNWFLTVWQWDTFRSDFFNGNTRRFAWFTTAFDWEFGNVDNAPTSGNSVIRQITPSFFSPVWYTINQAASRVPFPVNARLVRAELEFRWIPFAWSQEHQYRWYDWVSPLPSDYYFVVGAMTQTPVFASQVLVREFGNWEIPFVSSNNLFTYSFGFTENNEINAWEDIVFGIAHDHPVGHNRPNSSFDKFIRRPFKLWLLFEAID